MNELKPCKCKLCSLLPETWEEDHVLMAKCSLGHPEIRLTLRDWNALMDDTPALLRGARIGLGMAIHKMEVALTGKGDLTYKKLIEVVRAITDTDIMHRHHEGDQP